MSEIRVALNGFDKRSFSRMETLFKINFKGKCMVVESELADVYIIDVDNIDGPLGQYLKGFSSDKSILLSEGDSSFSEYRVLQKPAKLNELWESIIHAYSGVPASAHPYSARNLSLSGSDTAHAIGQRKKSQNNVKESDRIRRIGSQEYFNPGDFFVKYLKDQVDMLQREGNKLGAIRISCWNSGAIYILPSRNRLYTDLGKNRLMALTGSPFASELKKASKAILMEDPLSDEDMEGLYSTRLDACLWEMAYRTSRGRVPEDLDLEKTMYLNYWPNFTRLPHMANGMRIAALWAGNPQKLNDIATRLGIDKTEVYAFFYASSLVGASSYAKRESDILIESRDDKKVSASRGLLSEILRHVGKTFSKSKDELNNSHQTFT